MSILRLVRNFALLAVLALAAHAAAGADKKPNPHHCGGVCDLVNGLFCPKGCLCFAAGQGNLCGPKKLGG